MIKNPYDIFQPVDKDARLGVADFSKFFDGLGLHTMSAFFHTLTLVDQEFVHWSLFNARNIADQCAHRFACSANTSQKIFLY